MEKVFFIFWIRCFAFAKRLFCRDTSRTEVRFVSGGQNFLAALYPAIFERFSRQFFRNKSGFTLVEILMVIMIVGVLSVLAVNGYTEYRKSALLDLAADDLISQIYQLKEKASYGNVGSDKRSEIESKLKGDTESENGNFTTVGEDVGYSMCYGLRFVNDGETGFKVYSFSNEFGSKKVWDDLKGDWKYAGCGEFEANNKVREITFDDIVIQNISAGGDLNELVLMFAPPSAELFVTSNGEDISANGSAKIIINWKYNQNDNSDYKRYVLFDFKSKTATKGLFIEEKL